MQQPEIKWEIVNEYERFQSIVSGCSGQYVVADVETKGKRPNDANSQLLGVALSSPYFNEVEAIYVPFVEFSPQSKLFFPHPANDWQVHLATWLNSQKLVGHNFTFDRTWIDSRLGTKTTWLADTRIMWHLSSAPSGPRPYGLKDAQKEVLGWQETNEEELKKDVERKGGKLKNGDHYLASLGVLAKYACLDAYSTGKLFESLSNFFDKHEYWDFMRSIMAYNELLSENTALGLPLDKQGLEQALKSLYDAKEDAHNNIKEICEKEIKELEEEWKDIKQGYFKTDRGRAWFLADLSKHPKFNPSSDYHLRDLYYRKLGFPVHATTPGGRPKVDKALLGTMKHRVTDSAVTYNRLEKLIGYAKRYLTELHKDGAIHCGFNICGTVSGRLSGFVPNIQQAPFKEPSIMRNFVCRDGYMGIHADLSAIEPCVTAHYTDDPTLLKVFRDGHGDIYLDLAKELFPDQLEIYSPNHPVTGDTKDKFKHERDICKVLHLAMQYGGSQYTVSRNLTLNGVKTSPEEALNYVRIYWRKFGSVKRFIYYLMECNRTDGMVRTLSGRIIRTPEPWYKDLFNRVIQSSGHDILMMWAQQIEKYRRQYPVDMIPWVVDIHDSTTWMVNKDHAELGMEVFTKALGIVNDRLSLACPIRAEIKFIRSLADIKND